MRVGLLGSAGFIGTAISEAARRAGSELELIPLPRLAVGTISDEGHLPEAIARLEQAESTAAFSAELAGVDVVINAAGRAEPDSVSLAGLLAVNSVLPVLLARLCHRHGIRLVHVSSAAVQSGTPLLDETPRTGRVGPYGRSKVLAERGLLSYRAETGADVVIYRPGSVLHPARATGERLARALNRPVVPVTAGGRTLLPVAALGDVADLALWLAAAPSAPALVLHPSPEISQRDLIDTLATGRHPRLLAVPRVVCGMGRFLGRSVPRLQGPWQRLELWLSGVRIDAHGAEKAGFGPLTREAVLKRIADDFDPARVAPGP